MKAQKRLIDVFRKSYFDPKEFGGYFHDDFRFSRVFNYNGKPVKERFEEINDFLREQGFDALDYDVFIKDLGVRNENVLIYANDARDEKDVILFLMIDIYNPWSNPLDEILLNLKRFRKERDWEQFHNAKDLAIALNIESVELLENFLWKEPEDANVEKIKEELADVFIYAFYLALKYDFEVNDIVLDKIGKNTEKYPIEKAKGNAKKYDEL